MTVPMRRGIALLSLWLLLASGLARPNGAFCVQAPLPTAPVEPVSLQTWDRRGEDFQAFLWRVACSEENANLLMRIVPERGNAPEICSELFEAEQDGSRFQSVKVVLDSSEPKYCGLVSTPTTFLIAQKDGENHFDDDRAFRIEYEGNDDALSLPDYEPALYNAAGNQIAPGHTGSWYDPRRDGEGFNIEIVRVGDEPNLLAYWYTFDERGNQMYLVGLAPYQEGESAVTLPLQVTSGAVFGPGFDPDDVERIDWGTARLEFTSCNSLTVDYDAMDFGSGTRHLSRLTAIDTVSCP